MPPATEPETTKICDLKMWRTDGELLTVRLESIAYGPIQSRCCRTALVDLTGERHALEQLENSERRYRQLTETVTQLNEMLERRLDNKSSEITLLAAAIANLGEGILISNDPQDWPDGRIVFVNEAICRISGYHRDELLGKPPRFLYGDALDEADLARLQGELAAGRPCQLEMVHQRKDATSYHAELLVTRLVQPGGLRANVVAIHRDISTRKEAAQRLQANEQRLRAILETASDAIINIDRGGTITSVNPSAERMLGYDPGELIGQNVKRLMPAPYRNEHDSYIARYLETGEARVIGSGREAVALRKDGSTLPVELSVSEVDHLGIFTGMIHDITDRKLLQKQVLEIAAEEDRRIAYELHDSIQQQLTGLSLLASDLAETLRRHSAPEGSQAARLATGINETAREVHQLARGLAPVEVDAEGLQAALADLVNNVSQASGTHCELVSDSTEIVDNFVATHLYRIAQEAIQNAIKHASCTRIRVRLSGSHNRLRLDVEDDGQGFEALHARNSGLGLRIMEYRAGLLGGLLRVESTENGGTAIRCVIPRHAGPATRHPDHENRDHRSRGES